MSRKALVVDNDFFFVEFMSEILEKRGYKVFKAYDGKEGINWLKKGAVDLVFVDMVMPKIDGRQFIEFIQKRYPAKPFPVILMSSTVIEQLDILNHFGADFYITKGPMEKMGTHVNRFLDRFEKEGFLSFTDEKVFEVENLYPRRTTSELLDSLNFERGITESIGLGVLVIDKDARVLRANSLALEILGKSLDNTLGAHVGTMLKGKDVQTLIQALKDAVMKQTERSIRFYINQDDKIIQAYASLFRVDGKISGWILAMEAGEAWDAPA